MMTTRLLDQEARYALVGAIAEGRRVLDIGCGEGWGLAYLAEAGAAELVGTCDEPDAVRATLQESGIEGAELGNDAAPPLPYDDDAFNLIVCHDLAQRITDDDTWIAEIRRILADDGYLMLAVANADGVFMGELSGQRESSPLTYEECFEKLSESFGEAALYGQTPVVGSMFFDFESAEEDPDPSLDRSLMFDDEEPGWYVMVFGPEKLHRDDLAIVQHPFSRVIERAASVTHDESVIRLDEEDGHDASELEAQLAAEREHSEQLLQEIKVFRETAQSGEATTNDNEQLDALQQQIGELKAQLEAAQATSSEGHGDSRMNQASVVIAEQEDSLRAMSARAVEAEEQLAVERIKAYRAENRLQNNAQDSVDHDRQATLRIESAVSDVERAQKRQQEAEREVGKQADTIAELELQLKAAEEMFERTSGELKKIEEVAAERIAESQELTDGLLKETQAAADKRIQEAETRSRELEADLDEKLTEAREQSAAAAREETQAEVQLLKAEMEAQLEAAQNQARDMIGEATSDAHSELTEQKAQLEQEVDQLRSDNANFEIQIKDLLEEAETLQARGGDEAESRQSESARADQLLEELSRYKLKLQGIEEERDKLNAEVQRLTDALQHSREEGRNTSARDVTGAATETVVDAEMPDFAATAAPRRPTDSVGREIEASLEELEDLLTPSSNPGTTTR